MRKAATVVVATSLVVMVFAGIQPSGGQDPEGAEALGVYHRLGSDNDLTSEHVSWNGEALEVEGPAFTEKLEIEQTYLEEELGAWGSFQKFSVDKGIVQIDHAKAAFEAFNLDEEPIFTQGAGDQVKLLERPMWLNASQEAHGERITLTLEDGDSSGQQVFISRDWLWGRGIQWFNVTHEDGSLLPVTEQSGGVVVDVPHFSELNINPDELDVKQVVEGVTVDNLGDTRWHWQKSVLEVDVDNNPSGDYEVLISADWLNLHIRPETFNVYSSKELVESDPDTGIQVCCGGGGSSQDYYSVKFSTSGLSLMIEVIGEHLPVYTVQGGDLAPHWGEKRWNENTTVLEVDVEEQSSDYEVSVEKGWVDQRIPWPVVEGHNWTVDTIDGTEYYIVTVGSEQTPTTIRVMENPWSSHSFALDMVDFMEKIDLGQPVTLPIGDEGTVQLNLTAGPSQVVGVVHLANGTKVDVEKVELSLTNPDEDDVVPIDLHVTGESNSDHLDWILQGVLCHITTGDVHYGPDPQIEGMMNALWQSAQSTSNECQGSSSGYPYDPPPTSEARTLNGHLFGDESYRDRQGEDWYLHAFGGNSHSLARDMWRVYTGNVIGSASATSIDDLHDYDEIDSCDIMLIRFENFLEEQPPQPGNPYFILVTAFTSGGCTGIANTNGGVGGLADPPASMVVGVPSGSSYSATTNQLAKLMAQENGHVWGDPDHSCDPVAGTWSIMANSACASWADRKFWLNYDDPDMPNNNYDSRQRIKDGTSDYDL